MKLFLSKLSKFRDIRDNVHAIRLQSACILVTSDPTTNGEDSLCVVFILLSEDLKFSPHVSIGGGGGGVVAMKISYWRGVLLN